MSAGCGLLVAAVLHGATIPDPWERAPLPDQAPSLAAAEQEPDGAYARLLAARAMPARPHGVPGEHFLVSGTLTFQFADRDPVVNELEFKLGGPDRLSYRIRLARGKNHFFLSGQDRAWILDAKSPRGRSYPAEELFQQNWLRWNVARLPWDWDDGLRVATVDSEIVLAGPHGDARVHLDEEGRPERVEYAGTVLSISDYRALPSGMLLPRTWSWETGGRHMVERWETVDEGALILEQTFLPPAQRSVEHAWSVARRQDGSSAALTDSFQLVTRPELTVLDGPSDAAWALPLREQELLEPGIWWVVGDQGEKRAAVAVLPAARSRIQPERLPPGVRLRTEPGGLCLQWSHYGDLEPAAGARLMGEAVQKSGLRAIGPVWIQAPPEDARVRRRLLLQRVERVGR